MELELLGKLFEALSKAQATIKGAVKDSTNPFYSSSYADLQSVWDACREALTANGLCIIQATEIVGEKTVIKTILGHKDGGQISGILPIEAKDTFDKAGKNLGITPQAQGSAISYARRYALAAMVGVYQTDDDAELATARDKRPAPKAKEKLDMKPPAKKETGPAMMTTKEFAAYVTAKLGKEYLPKISQKLATTFKVDAYEKLTDKEKGELLKWVDGHAELKPEGSK